MGRFRELQVFDAVVQAGSLAAAARSLAVTPAAVIRSIAALEARLGGQLLIRTPRGVRPNATGEQFAASCRQILQATLEAERSVAGRHADAAGQLTVSLPLLMAHQLFMPIAVDYLRQFPQVGLQILYRETLPRLLEEGIDMAVVVGALPDSCGFAVPIGVVSGILCAAPAYLAEHGRPQTPADLASHRIILGTGSGAEWRFESGRGVQPVRLAPILTCTTQAGAIRASVSGLGLIRCFSYEIHEELQSGRLEPVLTGFMPQPMPVHLLHREGRRATARVRAFIDFAVPRLRTHPAFAS